MSKLKLSGTVTGRIKCGTKTYELGDFMDIILRLLLYALFFELGFVVGILYTR